MIRRTYQYELQHVTQRSIEIKKLYIAIRTHQHGKMPSKRFLMASILSRARGGTSVNG